MLKEQFIRELIIYTPNNKEVVFKLCDDIAAILTLYVSDPEDNSTYMHKYFVGVNDDKEIVFNVNADDFKHIVIYDNDISRVDMTEEDFRDLFQILGFNIDIIN